MDTPRFLTTEEVLEIHAGQIRTYGGTPGLRDPGLLESALAQATVTSEGQFLHPDLFRMAAVYLYHLVQNHPFLDGNKRIGLETALVFLELNGWSVEATDDELVELVLGTATGQQSIELIGDFLRAHAQPGETPG